MFYFSVLSTPPKAHPRFPIPSIRPPKYLSRTYIIYMHRRVPLYGPQNKPSHHQATVPAALPAGSVPIALPFIQPLALPRSPSPLTQTEKATVPAALPAGFAPITLPSSSITRAPPKSPKTTPKTRKITKNHPKMQVFEKKQRKNLEDSKKVRTFASLLRNTSLSGV